MQVITTTDALARLTAEYAKAPFVTVDTEFMRERTYWPQLCLIQIAQPGDGNENAAIIDPLARGIDLAPLFELMANQNVVKVFHAARQDVEIFHNLGGLIPAPINALRRSLPPNRVPIAAPPSAPMSAPPAVFGLSCTVWQPTSMLPQATTTIAFLNMVFSLW